MKSASSKLSALVQSVSVGSALPSNSKDSGGTQAAIPFLDVVGPFQELKPEVDQALAEIFSTGQFVQGARVKRLEQSFAEYCGTKHAIAVASGTDSLTISLRALGIQDGDEVITPAFTFVATAEAIVLAGGTPVYVDVDPDTLQLDATKLESALTERTVGILPVHLYGGMAQMDAIGRFAKQQDLWVLEDACQAHGARFHGQRAGSIGIAGCFSFYPGKNLGTCGEGGMIVTDDDAIARQARLFRDHGAEKKYAHIQLGSNARMSEIEAAILNIKLPHLDDWNEKRRGLAAIYREELAGLPLGVHSEHAGVQPVHHLFIVRTTQREALRDYLTERNIQSGIHYPHALHTLPPVGGSEDAQGEMPVSELAADQVLSLPMFPGLRPEQVRAVCAAVRDFLEPKAPLGSQVADLRRSLSTLFQPETTGVKQTAKNSPVPLLMDNIKRVNPRSDAQWAGLAEMHGDVFHSPAWSRVLHKAYGLESHAFLLLDEQGQARSGIISCSIEDPAGQREVSLPFSDYCDPLIGDACDWEPLADQWLTSAGPMRTRCLHSEAPLSDDRLEEAGWAYWHCTDLTRSEGEVWDGLQQGARRAIRKAERAGIQVRPATNKADLRAFYELHLRLRKQKYKLLAQPYAYFEALWSEFIEPGNGALLLAEHNGEIVAGVLLLEAYSKLYYKLNASDPSDLGQRPNDLLAWHAMQHGQAKRLELLDFGISDHDQPGLVRYKRKFASLEKRVTFLHRPSTLPAPPGAAEWRANLGKMTQLFVDPSVPDAMAEAAGEQLYRYFT